MRQFAPLALPCSSTALWITLLAAEAPATALQGAPEIYAAGTCEAGVVYATGRTDAFETLVTARDLSSGALLWSRVLLPPPDDSRGGREIAFVAPDSLALVEEEFEFIAPGFVDSGTSVLRLSATDGAEQWSATYYGYATDIAISGAAGKAAFVLAQGNDYVDFEVRVVDLDDPGIDYPTHGVYGEFNSLDSHQFAFSPDGGHLYQSYSYESSGLFTGIAGDALAHWDLTAGTLDQLELPDAKLGQPRSQSAQGINGAGQGRGLGLSPDGQRLYLAGAGPTTHQLVLDPFDLTLLDSLPEVRLGTSTCLAVTDAGPLYLGWRFGGPFEPNYADANYFIWLKDGSELDLAATQLADPCGANREDLHPAGAEFLFVRRSNAGCGFQETVEKRRIEDGALLWSHVVQPEISGSLTLNRMAYDSTTDSLCVLGRGQGQALTYVLNARTGAYIATHLD